MHKDRTSNKPALWIEFGAKYEVKHLQLKPAYSLRIKPVWLWVGFCVCVLTECSGRPLLVLLSHMSGFYFTINKWFAAAK